MGHQLGMWVTGYELSTRNGARNIYSNYNQIRAYVECSPNQQKYYTLSTFPSNNRRNFEDSGTVLAFEFYQSIAVQLYQPTLIKMVMTPVFAQIDNCFCIKYVNRCPSVCVAEVILCTLLSAI